MTLAHAARVIYTRMRANEWALCVQRERGPYKEPANSSSEQFANRFAAGENGNRPALGIGHGPLMIDADDAIDRG